ARIEGGPAPAAGALQDPEDGAPGDAEAHGQLFHGQALPPQLDDLAVPELVQERAQTPRLLVTAAGQRAGQATGVDVAAVVAVAGELGQRVGADALAWRADR